MIVLFIGFVAFLLGGYSGKVLAAFAALGIIGIVGLIAYSPNRLNRVLAAYQECSGTDAQKVCYQSIHAKYALAEGGLFGVGLGNSREKWNYLPEAHNDSSSPSSARRPVSSERPSSSYCSWCWEDA